MVYTWDGKCERPTCPHEVAESNGKRVLVHANVFYWHGEPDVWATTGVKGHVGGEGGGMCLCTAWTTHERPAQTHTSAESKETRVLPGATEPREHSGPVVEAAAAV